MEKTNALLADSKLSKFIQVLYCYHAILVSGNLVNVDEVLPFNQLGSQVSLERNITSRIAIS